MIALSRTWLLACALVVCARSVNAQEHVHNVVGERWSWSVEGRVFFGYNRQDRKFTDFTEWESQNWLMLSGGRAFGPSALHVVGMVSGEVITLRDIGSPQVFQTGETFKKSPLIDYQHPHDLVMNLGVEYSRAIGRASIVAGAYLVGPVPLGPQSFMHRPSAAENPQTPLSHHFLDSTHIANAVVSAGADVGGFRFVAAGFHGREPDENRADLDTGAIDSYAWQVSWARGPWSAQTSASHMKVPEASSPYDLGRVTASLSYFKGDDDRSLAAMIAFGQNREFFGDFEAYLFEATWRHSRGGAVYGRVEAADKDILDAGFHPIGFAHTHRPSPVSAYTIGYVREMKRARWGSVGVGADVTVYNVPANLLESYGSPRSFHLFARYRGERGRAPGPYTP